MEIFKQGNGEIKVKFDEKKKKSSHLAWKKQPESCLQKREVELAHPTAAKQNQLK